MMKFIKWKILIATCLVCLSPVIFGLLLWNSLPDVMPIHFDMYNNPDNFASKTFVVFILPVMMMLLQLFCCFVNDINAKKHGDRKKFELVTKWIIPSITVILQIVTLLNGLGYSMDIRRIATLIVASILILIGNYLPKFDYIKNYEIDTEKARKINRFIGYITVILGVLFFISVFLPPVFTVVCLLLMLPYLVLSVAYGIKVGKK